jgi:hypothetical protein
MMILIQKRKIFTVKFLNNHDSRLNTYQSQNNIIVNMFSVVKICNANASILATFVTNQLSQ